MAESEFQRELEALINRYSQENGSDTPDFILASFLKGSLKVFNTTVRAREKWYGRAPEPVGGDGPSPKPEGAETASRGAPIVPAIPHNDLRIEHRIFEEEELVDLKAHYRLDLVTPDGWPTAPGIIFHKGSPVEGWHGWTTAHVISGLIRHMEYHQSTKFACDQNDEILEHLKAAHAATEKRVAERKERGVLYDTEKP